MFIYPFIKNFSMFLFLSFIVLTGFSSFSVSEEAPKPILLPHLEKPILRREILIPNVGEFTVLKCDFHMHTVFSDGYVWPDFRVIEAWVTGLDAIAITEHVEGPISRPFLSGDDNSSYELIKEMAHWYDILIIRGCEITRKHPYGHFNALFLNDVNLVDHEDPFIAIENAVKQGAFIQWNHPEWNPSAKNQFDFRNKLLEKGYLHGVEVSNGAEWYPHMIDWANERNLTLLGNTDLHGVVMGEFNIEKYQRPMTLVLAKERSISAIREALDNRRTIAWTAELLIGKEEWLANLFRACVQFEKPQINNLETKEGKMVIKNPYDIPWNIQLMGPLAMGTYRLEPKTSAIVKTRGDNLLLKVKITNAWIGTNKNLQLEIRFD